MKIGTDGVLLGAWADLNHHPRSILDIGTGTGVIGLMMAQRSTAELIDALEIDNKAYQQCVENFENSPWSDRLFCYHVDFKTFAQEIDESYQHIICNPPFFETPKNTDTLSPARKKARFTTSLSYFELIKGITRLLTASGHCSLIIPYTLRTELIEMAAQQNLKLQRLTHIKGNPKAPYKRSLLQFGFNSLPLKKDELTIEIDRHQYTAEYKALTQDFYLKM